MQDLAVRFLASMAEEHRDARGQKLVIVANDWVGIHASVDGFYERPLLDLVFAFLGPLSSSFKKGVALDIGANIGNHSVYMSRRFRSVIAYEPHPLCHEVLVINAELSGNVSTRPFALGEADGVVSLCEEAGNLGASAVDSFFTPGAVTEGALSAPVKRLDGLIDDLSDVELLKIDVEGAEREVIQGAMLVIEKFQPIVLFEQLEASFDFAQEQPAAVALLRERGYKVCWIDICGGDVSTVAGRLRLLLRKLRGEQHYAIVFGEDVPKQVHPMLVAIPSRHAQLLQLEQGPE